MVSLSLKRRKASERRIRSKSMVSGVRLGRKFVVPSAMAVSMALVAAACGSSAPASSSASASSAAPATTAAKAPESVSVGFIDGFDGAQNLAVGLNQGFFSKAGLKVTTTMFQSGPPAIDAMASGKVDIAFIGPGALYLAAKGRADVIGVDDISADDALVSDSPSISSVSDLKGHTVITPVGTSGEMLLYLALKNAGLSLSSVKIQNVTPSSSVVAMNSHKASTASVWGHYIGAMQSGIPGLKVIASDKTFYPKVALTDVWVASPSFVAAHPGAVSRFMQAELQANQYYINNSQAMLPVVSKFVRLPVSALTPGAQGTVLVPSKQLVTDYGNGTVASWLKTEESMFISMGLLTQSVPVTSFWDPKYGLAGGKAAGFGA